PYHRVSHGAGFGAGPSTSMWMDGLLGRQRGETRPLIVVQLFEEHVFLHAAWPGCHTQPSRWSVRDRHRLHNYSWLFGICRSPHIGLSVLPFRIWAVSLAHGKIATTHTIGT